MHDDDGNENGKKAIGLDKQNNNFARFFAHFFAVVARLRRETAQFHVLLRTWTHYNNFFSCHTQNILFKLIYCVK